MPVLRTFFIVFYISLFSASSVFALSLTDSSPITATRNGQVIENVRIVANGVPAIRVSGFSGVIIRNVEIWHQGTHGIRCSNAPDLTITNVSIIHTGTVSPNATSNENNITCENSDRMIIDHVRLEGGSSGAYIAGSDNVQMRFIEGYNFKGPFPRGQLAQFNTSNNCLLEDFSAINDLDTSISWPEDNVSVFNSNNCIVRRGLLDGNNSNSGVGVMFEHADNGLVEDVDTVRQGNGGFSAYPGTNITFRRTRVRDNHCGDIGRGNPLSGGLAWTGSTPSSGLRIEDSHYYNLCGGIAWNRTSFTLVDVSSSNFQLRSPIQNQFPWEEGVNADFTSSTSGLRANFTNTSTSNGGTLVNRLWEFGDGGLSTRTNPNHTYSVGGTYAVSLTVTDSEGESDTLIKNVAVTEPPTAGFTFSVSGLTGSFTDGSSDSDGTIASRSWNFGDGGVSTRTNPRHTYAAAGTYTVRLTVTDNNGATNSLSKNVTLTVSNPNQAPIAGFTSSTSGLRANFTDTSSDSDGTIASRSWNFGDGTTSTTRNPSHTYSSSGIYTVNLRVTDNDGASSTFNRSVTVIEPNQAPVAGFTFNVSDLAVNFTDTSSDSDGTIASRSWNFGDGGVSTRTNPSHTYAGSGNYTMRLTVTDNDGASATFSKNVTIIDPNQAPKVSYFYCFLYGC